MAKDVRSAVAVLVAVIVATAGMSACGSGNSHSASTGSGAISGKFAPAGRPVHVHPVLDPSSRLAVDIGSTGGSVALAATGATLSVPANAIGATETVSMTGLKGMQGLPSGWTFVTGYDFGPTGLIFAQPSTLTIPAPPSVDHLYAFAYEGDQLERVPYVVNGGTIRANMSGFSGLGLIRISGEVSYVSNAHDIEQRSVEILANLVYQDVSASGTVTSATTAKVLDTLRIWYTTSVKPHLLRARTDSRVLKDAGREYFNWVSQTQLYGLAGRLTAETTEGRQLLAEAIRNGMRTAAQECVSHKDASKIAELLEWETLAQVSGLDAEPGLSSQDTVRLAQMCLRFKLNFETSFVGSGIDESASGTGEVVLGDDWQFSGSGTITENSVTFGPAQCSGGALGQPIGFTVEPTTLRVDIGLPPSASTSLVLDFTKLWSFNADYNCGGAEESLGGPSWLADFDSGHSDERTTNSQAVLYAITGWQYVGSSGVFAQKTYDRETTGGLHEKTVLTMALDPAT